MKRAPVPRTLAVGIVLACIWGAATAGDGVFGPRQTAPAEATFVGAEVCADCHAEVVARLQKTVHAISERQTPPGGAVTACEACHGPGSLHVDEGGEGWILGAAALRDLASDDAAAMCLQCHVGMQPAWHQSDHAGTDVACAACHADQVHFAVGVRPAGEFRVQGEFCLQCHPAQLADFRLQHRHPVLEGEMTCTDCHAPHGDPRDAAVLNDDSRACLRCHPEVAGPFVFEHEAADTEPCVACHRPHGSPNDRLLTQDNNSLCLRCHYEPGFPVLGEVDHTQLLGRRARCYDCHVEIHGSNSDESFREP